MNNLFGYKQRDTWLNQTTGTAKLIGFLALTTIGMISYDPRFLLGLGILAILLLRRAKIKYREYAFMLKLVLFFAVINLVMVAVLAPQYGVQLYGTRHVLLGHGYWALTQEQVFYELNLLLKYLFSLPLAIILLFTTNPSEFAASLNKIGGLIKLRTHLRLHCAIFQMFKVITGPLVWLSRHGDMRFLSRPRYGHVLKGQYKLFYRSFLPA